MRRDLRRDEAGTKAVRACAHSGGRSNDSDGDGDRAGVRGRDHRSVDNPDPDALPRARGRNAVVTPTRATRCPPHVLRRATPRASSHHPPYPVCSWTQQAPTCLAPIPPSREAPTLGPSYDPARHPTHPHKAIPQPSLARAPHHAIIHHAPLPPHIHHPPFPSYPRPQLAPTRKSASLHRSATTLCLAVLAAAGPEHASATHDRLPIWTSHCRSHAPAYPSPVNLLQP
ncbi:hypothetical protein HETIRDRAFT_456233 [Heterobasidion irregulare TC 32-1]|uniref:Uncharacterized protein n=1 Tax=Heterobasidion irregulare (strain TC 32-1) TaxID=747525 RepID=W4JMH0_HETIT|nr:uncharacterized protein HETIRDRAFT_456233 [Heterobasidion irregulare TC 32-1]ETW74664.1 hypothetical protein HETIRDRAFT_456233 [Heterobasidion irregulare TC 32-1]